VKTDPDALALALLEVRSREAGVEALFGTGAAVLAVGPALGAVKECVRAVVTWRAVRAARRELALRLAVIEADAWIEETGAKGDALTPTGEVPEAGPPGGSPSGSPPVPSGGPAPETSPPPVFAGEDPELDAFLDAQDAARVLEEEGG
jgi:hypothetical protein